MDDEKKAELLRGMFAGATFTNSVVVGVAEKGAQVSYHGKGAENVKVKPEQMARALASICGTGRVVSKYQDWLGACCLLSSKYGYAMNLSDCVEQINQLPFAENELTVECRYENLRKFGSYRFVAIGVERWQNYSPSRQEEAVFKKCVSVARALENEIQKQLEAD